jgi:inactivated superfamily I helicase
LAGGNLPVPGGRRPDPLQLADTTLYLPTRRATRALQEAFLKVSARCCCRKSSRSLRAAKTSI